MAEASVTSSADGIINLAGVLDFRSGPALRAEGRRLINRTQANELVLDCSTVGHSSSVGLSLLLAFMRDAAGLGKTVRIRGLSAELRQIADVSALLEILPLEA